MDIKYSHSKKKLTFYDFIERQMTELKGVGRRGGTELINDLRNRRTYWELKKEAKDRKKLDSEIFFLFHKAHASANKQHTVFNIEENNN